MRNSESDLDQWLAWGLLNDGTGCLGRFQGCGETGVDCHLKADLRDLVGSAANVQGDLEGPFSSACGLPRKVKAATVSNSLVVRSSPGLA